MHRLRFAALAAVIVGLHAIGVALALAGTVGAILFAITSARIFWGEQLLPIASPLPFFAYPFLVLAFVGWIWTLLKAA